MEQELLFSALIFVTLSFIAVLTVLVVIRRKPLEEVYTGHPVQVFKKNEVKETTTTSDKVPSISPALREILSGLVDCGIELNDFEKKFCKDILNSNYYLSAKQVEIITNLWRRASAQGFTGDN